MSSLRTDVTMPQMGVSVSEGTIVEWRKQVGDWVEYEETICEISTDKIDTELPSPAAGRLAEIMVGLGETVDVGTVLARLETDAKPGDRHPAEDAAPAAEAPAPAAAEALARPARGAGSRHYSPVVSRIAAEHGVDLETVTGTGRGGRVRKQDVLAALEQGPGVEDPPMHIESPYRPDPAVPTATRPAPAANGAIAGGGLSRMRRQIGEHMKRSLEVAATCTTWIEVDFSKVEAARAELGVTALAIVARATVEALRAHPALNATLDGDAYAQHEDVGLGIAVSLGEDGLIVPVIHDAQDLAVPGLAKRIRELAGRARSRELVPDDLAGGTFTITNPGQFGAIMATPIINQPQVGILDLEAVVKRPVVVTGPDGTDAIAIRPICILGLSWDHRALDGVLAAQFLADIRDRLESFRA